MTCGYVRVSTQTQAEKGYGLDTQRAAIEAYAADSGLAVTRIFADKGVSGAADDTADEDKAISKRVALLDMLAALQPGDTVIVLNTSRLWRSDMAKAIIRRELIQRGARVLSIEQPRYDLYAKDPSDYLINAIVEALDVYERMSISIKLAHGRTTKARSGDKPAGVTPYGYKYSADGKHVEVDAAEAKHVKQIFQAASAGQSLSSIVEMLEGQGTLTRRGKQWSRQGVAAILHNSFYAGTLTHQGATIPGNHPAIISEATFGRTVKQLERHQRCKP